MQRFTTMFLLALVAFGSTACLRTLRTITAEEWDQLGKAQLYVGYWEGKCSGGLCFSTKGKLLMCRLRDDNSMDCSEQTSLTDALATKD